MSVDVTGVADVKNVNRQIGLTSGSERSNSVFCGGVVWDCGRAEMRLGIEKKYTQSV